MTEYNSAKEEILDRYSIDEMRKIVDEGCVANTAADHTEFAQTIKFFDDYENEILGFIADVLGEEHNEELWDKNRCDVKGYKNETTWNYIEVLSAIVVSEFDEKNGITKKEDD